MVSGRAARVRASIGRLAARRRHPTQRAILGFVRLHAMALALVALAGCAAAISALDRRSHAERIAGRGGLARSVVATDGFVLTTYHRLGQPGHALRVYIEGDGLAWMSRRRLSRDPTPVDPLALDLAALDPAANVVYLARPCQYTEGDALCGPDYWSSKRFAEVVIVSMDQAVERFRRQARAKEVHLIGYSGGAAVAALIAARRRDVASLRTVAGNLDPVAFNRHHGVSPDTGSLNAADAAPALAGLAQHHFVGRRDAVVPPFIAEGFARAAGDRRCIRITVLDGVGHADGWRERWRDLLRRPVTCSMD